MLETLRAMVKDIITGWQIHVQAIATDTDNDEFNNIDTLLKNDSLDDDDESAKSIVEAILQSPKATEVYDGYMPHGSRDWTAIRRLQREALVEASNDFADCMTCPTMHEGPAFRLTVHGMHAVEPTEEDR